MAGTILEYLEEYGDCSLRDIAMNDVDSLVLCQFAYLKFDGMVPGIYENKPSVTMQQLAEHADYEKLFADERYEKDNRALFEGMISGQRFRNMKMNCYINIVEKEWETQFSAITFLLEDGTLYIAFRGTDETIVGWKEDFNMSFLSPVPGQAYSVKYLNMVTGRLHSDFYLGGHSKGGNLAVYSAMNCAPYVQERILKIYSMDGPGFRPEVLEADGYRYIADRVVKIVPRASLIGMIFEWNDDYVVVDSKKPGLAQHNPYNWLVEKGSFVIVEEVDERHAIRNRAVNEWMLGLQGEQLKLFVEALFQVLEASQAEDLIAFTADWRKSIHGMVDALKQVDGETKKAIGDIIKLLFDSYGNHKKSRTPKVAVRRDRPV